MVDEGRELALTLLRATGYLSRTEPALRPNPAGPMDPLEGPQLQGRHVVDYALLPHRGDWSSAGLYDAADAFLVPLERNRVAATPGAAAPPSGQALQVDGAQVSALRREGETLIVRVFNASAEDSTVTVEQAGVAARGFVVDLVGRPRDPFDGWVRLGPWEIATLALTASA